MQIELLKERLIFVALLQFFAVFCACGTAIECYGELLSIPQKAHPLANVLLPKVQGFLLVAKVLLINHENIPTILTLLTTPFLSGRGACAGWERDQTILVLTTGFSPFISDPLGSCLI